jgi:hypothetical protein
MKLVKYSTVPTTGRNPIVVNSKKKEWLIKREEGEEGQEEG